MTSSFEKPKENHSLWSTRVTWTCSGTSSESRVASSRPPLQPGEWRTIGLFAADDDIALEKSLASMPLRVWRSDEVTPLSDHPNDPGPRPSPSRDWTGTEFLTTFTLSIPPGTPASLV